MQYIIFNIQYHSTFQLVRLNGLHSDHSSCVSNIHGIVVPKSNPFTWCS